MIECKSNYHCCWIPDFNRLFNICESENNKDPTMVTELEKDSDGVLNLSEIGNIEYTNKDTDFSENT